MVAEASWNTLTAREKQEKQFEMWLSPEGIEAISPEARADYKTRVTLLKDAIQLTRTPARVPVFPNVGFYPAVYAGITAQEAMYNYDKMVMAWTKYTLDFEPDLHPGALVAAPGKMFEILDYKLYNWPGHGVRPEYTYQCVESEYMKLEDYDTLIQDPTDFWLRVYLPRIAGVLQGFGMLSPLTEIVELPFMPINQIPYGLPPVRAAFEKMLEAGEEALRWAGAAGQLDAGLLAAGFPNGFGGASKAPFDVLGDTLRGTRAIMADIYRCPNKLIAAMERLTPLMIRMGIAGAKVTRRPIILIPLHKGAEGFMSDEQFKIFYWPTLRKVIMGLVEEGLVPLMFAEGAYGARLEVIRDLPKGTTIWYFDYTDMEHAKEVLGDTACIMGNVSVSLLQTGTPEQVTAYCKRLIDTAGKGGGFVLGSGAVIEEAKTENLHAMVRCAKEYGVYR